MLKIFKNKIAQKRAKRKEEQEIVRKLGYNSEAYLARKESIKNRVAKSVAKGKEMRERRAKLKEQNNESEI